ncbi:MAG: hypothetical protein JKY92_04185 [Magnetovibrio sp.]|nr:hypothetical protein [Magnetovibrio sp.]
MKTFLLSAIRMLGIPGILFLGLFYFYEGLPLLRKIPFIHKVDVVGHLIVGRVEAQRRAARLDRDRFWQAKVREAENRLEKIRVDQARKLAANERRFLEQGAVQSLRDRNQMNALDRALSNISKQRKSDGKTCRPCVDRRVPDQLLRIVK